jgi:hypothetical protein
MGGTIMAEVIVIRPVGSKLLLVIRPQVQTVKKTPPLFEEAASLTS